MPIKVTELHHHAVAAGASGEKLAATRAFYSEMLGLRDDVERPDFGIDGNWYHVGPQGRAQVHIIAVDVQVPGGPDAPANPLETHLALAVEDLAEAQRELEQRGVPFVLLPAARGVGTDQIFLRDPMGHMIELHEDGTCRCNEQNLPKP
ncbi:MAG: VOC family protein [Deltaproteobacteria bacterium]